MKRALGYLAGLALAVGGFVTLYRPAPPGALRDAARMPARTLASEVLPAAAGFETRAVAAAPADRALAVPDAAHTPLVRDFDQAVVVQPPMFLRTATMRLRVDSLAPALERVYHIAQALEAVVAASDTRTGDAEHRSATVELRVPADRFDRLVEAVRRLGTADELTVQLEDAAPEYVDVNARLNNGRRLESRLLQILATRAGKLSDVLLLERELASVREESDVLEARRRYLQAHAATSTLTLELAEPSTMVGVAAPGVMRLAVEQSWDGFVWVVALLVRSVGVVVPLGLLALLGWAGYRRFAPRELPATRATSA